MKEINELWLAIEELKENSHPPVDWMEIIESLIVRVEELEKLGNTKRGRGWGIGHRDTLKRMCLTLKFYRMSRIWMYIGLTLFSITFWVVVAWLVS